MADRQLMAMRRVAAIRSAQRAVAATALHDATQRSAHADAALATATQQAQEVRFEPDTERRHAAQLIDADRAQGDAEHVRAGADDARTQARQGLHRADAAVEQSGSIVGKLHRADRRRREERRLAEHADSVTRRWSRS